MQHYGAPTRLLDVTTNPLVALYFACDEKEVDGGVYVIKTDKTKIKRYDSDAVSYYLYFLGLIMLKREKY